VRTTASSARSGPLRWGVLGATSTVARLAVMPAIEASRSGRLVALASLSARPDEIAGPVGGRVHPSYQSLLDDPEVDAVYVPLPNGMHREWVTRAARAGKHVLCEKPLAVSPSDATAMVAECEEAGVVLMEAYMTPFHPRAEALSRLVAEGGLGELRFARTAFTGVLGRADDHRWDPAMGGGALLDLGIYCLSPLLEAAGREPVRLSAAARVAPSGVDSSFSGWLDFGEGLTGAFECSFDAPERQHLELVGSQAAAFVDRAFTPGPCDRRIALRPRRGEETALDGEGDDPYRAMVDHMAEVVRGGGAPRRAPGASIALLELVERLRGAAGLGG
jgi:xylose dehydrogenase (NAD/NADP)